MGASDRRRLSGPWHWLVLLLVPAACVTGFMNRKTPGDASRGDLEPRSGEGDELGFNLVAEDPDTTSIDTARVWDRAYTELVDFEETVLARLEDLLPTLSTAARQEAERTNLPMIVDHLKTFRYRRAHWRKRLAELDGH